jgi:hypothetical protein
MKTGVKRIVEAMLRMGYVLGTSMRGRMVRENERRKERVPMRPRVSGVREELGIGRKKR